MWWIFGGNHIRQNQLASGQYSWRHSNRQIQRHPHLGTGSGVRLKFEAELKRYNKFNRGVLGMRGNTTKHEDIDLTTYVQYILKDGTNEEKRELLGCFKSRLVVARKVVAIKERQSSIISAF